MKEMRGRKYPLWWCSKLRPHDLTISSSYSPSKTTFLTFAMFLVQRKTYNKYLCVSPLCVPRKLPVPLFFPFLPRIRCKWISGLGNTLTNAKTRGHQNKKCSNSLLVHFFKRLATIQTTFWTAAEITRLENREFFLPFWFWFWMVYLFSSSATSPLSKCIVFFGFQSLKTAFD